VTGRRGGRNLRDGNGNLRQRGFRDENSGSLGYNGRRQRPGQKNNTADSFADEGSLEQAPTKIIKVYAYGVARNRLKDAAKKLGVQVILVDSLEEADVLVTLKSYYRKKRRLISSAEQQRRPVYVLRANSANQMERFLMEAMDLEVVRSDPFEDAVQEAEKAIELVRAGQPSVDLSPVSSAIRRYQHQMARKVNLVSHSFGREPRRHVRIYKTRRNDT